MHLTIIHPCIGRRKGAAYIRTWQMESLPAAIISGLTPDDIQRSFYDDRMEAIPFDLPTDLVAISIETYTAKRAYQIASEYRKRGVPVVMGGFHATLCPDEVAIYAESVLIGEAENLWPKLLDDFRHGQLQKFYRAEERPALHGLRYDRSIFSGRRYLPLGLIEAGRGCHFKCEFCAVQSYFKATHNRRPVADVIAELKQLKGVKRSFFFVDDNITSNIEESKALLRAMIPLGIKWVAQASINIAHDAEFLDLLSRSGCQGVLIGFESLDQQTLKGMGKGFNLMGGGYEASLANLRRAGIRIYATFVFGSDHDTAESFEQAYAFAMQNRFYITAFNHMTPFPGTPLYQRLQQENRLLYDQWWLDSNYRYNTLPFQPKLMEPEEVQQLCLRYRKQFYSLRSIAKRGLDRVNASNTYMFFNYFMINAMHRAEIHQRDGFPLGDENWQGEFIPC